MNVRAIEDTYPLGSEDTRAHLLEVLREAPLVDDHGRRLTVVVQRKRPKPGKDDPEEKARKLMHIWIGQMAKAAGDCSPGEMRFALRRAHLPLVDSVDPLTGECLQVPMSTNDLHAGSTPTMSQFLDCLKITAEEMWGLQLRSNKEDEMLGNHAVRDAAYEDDARFNR